MEWIVMPLKRYADFSGRSRRKEYWMFTLGLLIAYTILAMLLFGSIDPSSGEMSGMSGMAAAILVLLGLAIIVPAMAVQVRRFHDQDRSGWLVLLNLIPYLGGFIVLIMMCLEGTNGANRYGPDPKSDDKAHALG